MSVTPLSIITPREMVPEAEAYFVTCGCTITRHTAHAVVTFPIGTTRREILPRMPQSVRYDVCLSDGTIIRQVYVRHLEQSVLYYPKPENYEEEV